MPLLKVFTILQDALHDMTPALISSVEVWLNEVQHLPDEPHNSDLEDALERANAAWQHAPKSPSARKNRAVTIAWCGRLSGLITAIIGHLEQQVRIRNSQMEKLQALSEAKSVPQSSQKPKISQKQLAEQLAVEWGNYRRLHSLHSVCAVIGPAAAAAVAMHENVSALNAVQALGSRPPADPSARKAWLAYSESAQLLNAFRETLSLATRSATALAANLRISELTAVPLQAGEPQEQAAQGKDMSIHVQAARTWLNVAAELPQNRQLDTSTAAQLLVCSGIHWPSVVAASSFLAARDKEEFECLRSLIYDVLGRNDLCYAIVTSTTWPPSVWGSVLRAFNITAPGLQAAGMPEQGIHLLMGWKYQAALQTREQHLGDITAVQLQAVGIKEQSIKVLMDWKQQKEAHQARGKEGSSSKGQVSSKGSGAVGSKGGLAGGRGLSGSGGKGCNGDPLEKTRQQGNAGVSSSSSTNDSTVTASAHSGRGGDQGDMQALLDMMYGASAAKELQATCAASNSTTA